MTEESKPSIADAVQHKSARVLQSKWRSRAIRAEIQAELAECIAEPSLHKSKKQQLALLPKDQLDRLLPLFCSIDHFKVFGSGVYCYMLWIRFMATLFLFASAVSVPMIFNNMAGSRFGGLAGLSLGNADDLDGSYGATLMLTTAIFLYGILRGRAIIRKGARDASLHAGEDEDDEDDEEESLGPPPKRGPLGIRTSHVGAPAPSSCARPSLVGKRPSLIAKPTKLMARQAPGRPNKALALLEGSPSTRRRGRRHKSVAVSSVMLRGLPAEFGRTMADTEELRQFLSQWGQHPAVVVARNNRALIRRMPERQPLLEALHFAQAQLYTARNPPAPSSSSHNLMGGFMRAPSSRRGESSSRRGDSGRSATPPRGRSASPQPPGKPRPKEERDSEHAELSQFPAMREQTTHARVRKQIGDAKDYLASKLDNKPKPLVGEALAPYLAKVEAARADLAAFDKLSREMMKQQHACAGVAFVTFERRSEAAECLHDLAQQRNCCARLLAPPSQLEGADARDTSAGRLTSASKVLPGPLGAMQKLGSQKRISGVGGGIGGGIVKGAMHRVSHAGGGRSSAGDGYSGVPRRSIPRRQLEFRGVLLEARPAPAPSDVQWEDLATTPRETMLRQLCSTSITLLIVLVGTSIIVLMNVFLGFGGSKQISSFMLGEGAEEGKPGTNGTLLLNGTLAGGGATGCDEGGGGGGGDDDDDCGDNVHWVVRSIMGAVLALALSVPTIIGNVIVFATCPALADNVERHDTFTGKEQMMATKMAMFQVFNTVVAAFSFLVFLPTNFVLGREWYRLGAATVAMILSPACDGLLIPFLLDLINLDTPIKRYLLAPKAKTQLAMDRLYIKEAGIYLAFRMQLAVKVMVLAMLFGAAIPVVYPFGFLYFVFAEGIDRYNLLRNMGPPPRTTAHLAYSMHSTVLPVAVVLHAVMAVVFFLHIAIDDARVESGKAAWELYTSPPPPPPLPPPPPTLKSKSQLSSFAEFTTGQNLSITSAIVVACMAAAFLSTWALWGKLRQPRMRTRARLPTAMRKKLAYLDASSKGGAQAKGGPREATVEADTYTPPLTATLLSMSSSSTVAKRFADDDDSPMASPLPGAGSLATIDEKRHCSV